MLNGKTDAINLPNYNVQITLCKAYLQNTVRLLLLLQQHLEIQLKMVSHCSIIHTYRAATCNINKNVKYEVWGFLVEGFFFWYR